MLVLLRATERAATGNKEEGGSRVELHRSGAWSWWSLVCESQVDQGVGEDGGKKQEGGNGFGFVEMGSMKKP